MAWHRRHRTRMFTDSDGFETDRLHAAIVKMSNDIHGPEKPAVEESKNESTDTKTPTRRKKILEGTHLK